MAVAMPSGPVSHGYCAMAAFADSSGPRCWTPRHCQDRDLGLQRGQADDSHGFYRGGRGITPREDCGWPP